jgi:hypothetical protein
MHSKLLRINIMILRIYFPYPIPRKRSEKAVKELGSLSNILRRQMNTYVDDGALGLTQGIL